VVLWHRRVKSPLIISSHRNYFLLLNPTSAKSRNFILFLKLLSPGRFSELYGQGTFGVKISLHLFKFLDCFYCLFSLPIKMSNSVSQKWGPALTSNHWSRNSSVSILSRLRAGRTRSRGLIPGWDVHLHDVQADSWTYKNLLSSGYWEFFPWGKLVEGRGCPLTSVKCRGSELIELYLRPERRTHWGGHGACSAHSDEALGCGFLGYGTVEFLKRILTFRDNLLRPSSGLEIPSVLHRRLQLSNRILYIFWTVLSCRKCLAYSEKCKFSGIYNVFVSYIC
jgi:hypothetical protein